MAIKSFIRLEQVDYNPEEQDECLAVAENACIAIDDFNSSLPGKAGDIIQFQINKFDLNDIYDVSDYKIMLTSCGVPVALNIGVIEEGTNNMWLCSATIPIDTDDGCYELAFYVDYTPADCSLFEGLTLQQVIDLGTILGDVLECTLNDFI